MFTTIEYESGKIIKELLETLDERYKTLKTEINQYPEESKEGSPQAFCLALDKERLVTLVKCEQRVYSLLPLAYLSEYEGEDEDEVLKDDEYENEEDEDNEKDNHDDRCPTEFGKFANTLACYTKCLVNEQCETVTGRLGEVSLMKYPL